MGFIAIKNNVTVQEKNNKLHFLSTKYNFAVKCGLDVFYHVIHITSAGEAGVDMTGYTGTDGGSGVLGAVGNKSNSNQNCSKLQEWAGQRLTAETGEGTSSSPLIIMI